MGIDAGHNIDKAISDAVRSLEIPTVTHIIFHDYDDPDVFDAVFNLMGSGVIVCGTELGVLDWDECPHDPKMQNRVRQGAEAVLCERGPTHHVPGGRMLSEQLMMYAEYRRLGWIMWPANGGFLGFGRSQKNTAFTVSLADGTIGFKADGHIVAAEGSKPPADFDHDRWQFWIRSPDGALTLGLEFNKHYEMVRAYRTDTGEIWGFGIYSQHLSDFIERHVPDYRVSRYSYDVDDSDFTNDISSVEFAAAR